MWDAMPVERHARDSDDECHEIIRQLLRRLAEAEEERAAMAAAIERDRALMRAENTMLRARLAEVAALRDAWEDAAAYADRTIPLRPRRPDPVVPRRHLRALPVVVLGALIACRGAFSAVRHSRAVAMAGHAAAAHKVLLASAVPAGAALLIVAAPAWHVLPDITGAPGPGPSAAVRAVTAPAGGGGVVFPTPGSPAADTSSAPASPSASASTDPAGPGVPSPSPAPTGTPAPAGSTPPADPPPADPPPPPQDTATPGPSPADTPTDAGTPAPSDSPSPADTGTPADSPPPPADSASPSPSDTGTGTGTPATSPAGTPAACIPPPPSPSPAGT